MKIKIEHIDKLTRGKKSGAGIGSRAVGHHLFEFERRIYERALKMGYLEVEIKTRENLMNVWEKVCLAKGWRNLLLIKDVRNGVGKVMINGEFAWEGELKLAKKKVVEMVKCSS